MSSLTRPAPADARLYPCPDGWHWMGIHPATPACDGIHNGERPLSSKVVELEMCCNKGTPMRWVVQGFVGLGLDAEGNKGFRLCGYVL